MSRRIVSLFSIVLILATTASLPAGTIAVRFDTTSDQAILGNTGTIGWQFQAASAITVTDLGWFDGGYYTGSGVGTGNGFREPHEIGLWSLDGTLLTSATLGQGESGTLLDGFRYTAVAPQTLIAGEEYIIAGTTHAIVDEILSPFTPMTPAAEITFLGLRFVNGSGTSLGFPSQGPDDPSSTSLFGPNFRFTTGGSQAAVPEPGTLGLLASGAVGLVGGWFRKRRQTAVAA